MAAFTNQATLSYNDNVVNSNIVTGEIVEVLSVSKTALSETYGRGKNITYIVNIVNSGDVDYTGLTVTDDLGSYAFTTGALVPLTYVNGTVRYFINGDLQSNATVDATDPLTVSGITVPAKGNATIVYSTVANEFAPLAAGSQINNTVTVTGTGITTPITAEEVIDLETGPVLSISKAVNPLSVPENGTLTYTFVITNTGFSAADEATSVVIRDTFNPILDITAVTLNGTALAPATGYTYDAATGMFATVAGAVTVPAATYTQDTTTGAYTITPGVTTLTVTGTV